MDRTAHSGTVGKKPFRITPTGVLLILLPILVALGSFIYAAVASHQSADSEYTMKTTLFTRAATPDEEGYDEDSTLCRVEYVSADGRYVCAVTYSYEDWEELPEGDSFIGYVYLLDDGTYAAFREEATAEERADAWHEARVDENAPFFNAGTAFFLLAVGIAIMVFFGSFFTLYEKVWFLSILVLATVVAILVPEEDCNGVNGILIMALYLADTFLNILCELLIAKQSKWNFLVSVGVEVTEILICILLAYRFATMATTLFFWLPVDIVSFINWNRHPDRKEEELTEVRRLGGWQEALVLLGIAVWTVGIGYLLSGIEWSTDLFGGNKTLETVVCYLDACASAVGIANGLFILFRYEEQWAAWIIEAILEGAINILSGQYVLLVLKLGYLTNSTYGLIKWRKYIRAHGTEQKFGLDHIL